nr:C25 family cysteine peptidase [bacterium]
PGAEMRIARIRLPDAIRVAVRDVGWFRDWRIAAIDLIPPENQVSGEGFGSFRFDVEFRGELDLQTGEPHLASPDPLTEIVMNLVVNPVQAASWRRPISRSAPRTNTRDAWYDPARDWHCIRTSQTGRLTLTDQIDFSGSDPRHIGVYNQGQAIPVTIDGEEDGTWDPDDRIEFYAEAYRNPDGTENKYTLENTYWIAVTGETGLRMNTRPGGEPGGAVAEQYTETVRREDNRLTAYGDYYWTSVLAGSTVAYEIHADDLADSGPCVLRFRVMGMTSIVAADPDHHLITSFNGVVVDDATWDSIREYAPEIILDPDLMQEGVNTITFNMPGDTAAGDLDGIYLDWFEISYPRSYESTNDDYLFSGPWPEQNGLIRFQIDGFSTPDIAVWRLDTHSRMTGITVVPTGASYRVSFSDTNTAAARYLAFDFDAAGQSGSLSRDDFADLANPQNQADYLIITTPDFEPALEPLITTRSTQGMTVKTIMIQDIYDEFNHGIFSPEAIRDFVDTAYHSWRPPAPSALLLVGDASWDYKGYLPDTQYVNYVPSYGKDWGGNAASSPYDRGPTDALDLLYGEPMVDEQMVCVSGDDLLPDMLLGRWAVTSSDALEEIVTRTLAGDAESEDQNWWKRCYFINGGFTALEHDTFESQSENLIRTMIDPSGAYWKPIRTYKTTEGHEYGQYTDEIIGYLNRGVQFVNYFGHAGTWSWESMLSFDDLARLENAGATPFVASMTCNTSRFANPVIQSFGERMMATGNPETGAVAVWGGCNFGGFWSDYFLAYFFYDALFRQRLPTYGESILYSKLENLIRYPSYAIIIEPYTYLGEPFLGPQRPSRPQIWLSGWTDTRWNGSSPAQLSVLAFVLDPGNDIETVELIFAGESLGLELYDDGQHGDYGAGDGIFGRQLPVSGGAVPPMMLNIGIRATDVHGNSSGIVNGLMSW